MSLCSVVLVLDEVPLSGKLAAYCQQMKIQVVGEIGCFYIGLASNFLMS